MPHLLDVNVDLCHHIHDMVKKFLNNFGNYLEKLFRDLYRDFDLSADLVKRLTNAAVLPYWFDFS